MSKKSNAKKHNLPKVVYLANYGNGTAGLAASTRYDEIFNANDLIGRYELVEVGTVETTAEYKVKK